jgi:adenine-specific DNA-methyltransferase
MWKIPRDADPNGRRPRKRLHADWWKERIARAEGIDASIAAKADYEYLYDKTYERTTKRSA